MIRATLTHPFREPLELDLPAPIETLVRRETLAQLAWGQAGSLEFRTPDPGLNAGLSRCLPEGSQSGNKELCMLAYLLKRMDGQRLALLRDNLPDGPCTALELCRRARFFCHFYLDRDGQVDQYVVPLEQFHEFDRSDVLEELLRMEYLYDLETQRLSSGQLFSRVVELAMGQGALTDCEPILDYILPADHDAVKIQKYEFDFQPVLSYGSEGLYLQCGLAGDTGNPHRDYLGAGTIKTLKRDLDACKRMGELSGILLHYESEYVNSHLDLLASIESHDHTIAHWLKYAAAEEALGASGLQYISHQNIVGRLPMDRIFFVPELGEGGCDAWALCITEDHITECPVWEPENQPVQFSDRADGSIRYMWVDREDVDSGLSLSELHKKLLGWRREFTAGAPAPTCPPSFRAFASMEQPAAVMLTPQQQDLNGQAQSGELSQTMR